MGIIDILQPYNPKKQLEHWVKSLVQDDKYISAVDPTWCVSVAEHHRVLLPNRRVDMFVTFFCVKVCSTLRGVYHGFRRR